MSKKNNITPIDIAEANKQFFINYGVSVASDRALPDVKDGLKPVQRRILFSMYQSKLNPNAKPMKSQQITGDVMGRLHPHADSYGSLVYLTQPWTFTLNPIDGTLTSFGNITGTTAAAARYTETRLTKYGQEMIGNCSDKIVPYEPNYDNTTTMPKVFPAKLPYLLINGVKTGIAVGFTSTIAPHHPVDAIELTKAYLQNSALTLDDAIEIIKGPDLPTHGSLLGDPRAYYQTGVGRFINRGTIIDDPESKNGLVITEIPFEMGGAVDTFIDKVKDMIIANKLRGIKAIDDYTTAEDAVENRVHIDVTLQSGMDHEQAKAMLFAKTDLSKTYSLSWMALDGKVPKQYNLMSYLHTFAGFQHRLVIREFKVILDDSIRRQEIVEGLISVPGNITAIIHAARNTTGKDELVKVLTGEIKIEGQLSDFSYSPRQADSIATMRIYQLNKIDADALFKEQKELYKKIKQARILISDKGKRVALLVKRMDQAIEMLKKDGFTERRTKLLSQSEVSAYTEQTIISEVTLTIDKYQYLKMTDRKSVSADDIVQIIDTTDDDMLVIFTNKGKMYQLPFRSLKKYGTRDGSRGDALQAVFSKNGLQNDEQVLCYTTRKALENDQSQLVFVSKLGSTKRTITLGSKFITKTMRKSVEAWKPKFDNDELLLIQLIQQEDIESNEIIAISENETYKRLRLSDLNLVGAAGSGSNTLIPENTHRLKLKTVQIMGENTSEIQTGDETISIEKFELMKPTQKFRPIHAQTAKSSDKTHSALQGYAYFDGSDTVVFGWGDQKPEREALLAIDYQQLIETKLLFVHDDGTAKIVSGDQFKVSTKRSQIQADKKGVKSIFISTIPESIIGIYEDHFKKRVLTSLISEQGKSGGGVRALYSDKHHLVKVEDGNGSSLECVSLATQPKQVNESQINLF